VLIKIVFLLIFDFFITHLNIFSSSNSQSSQTFVIKILFSLLHLSAFFSDFISFQSQIYFQFLTFINHKSEYTSISSEKLILILLSGLMFLFFKKIVFKITISGIVFLKMSYFSQLSLFEFEDSTSSFILNFANKFFSFAISSLLASILVFKFEIFAK
jgi:hypothetical protein